MLTYKINNQQGYEKIKQRVEKGSKYLEGKWFDPVFAKAVSHYMAMASAMLVWEVDCGTFEKDFEKWRLERV